MERQGLVTIHGNPLTLVGPELKVGDAAPAFSALDNDLNPVSLDDFQGQTLIISSVPSLDTPVCDLQTRRFNAEAGKHPDVKVLTLSMDLPFAQKRWCGAAGADHVLTLSDHRDAAFGSAWGLLLKELRLLARAVAVVGKDGKIAYLQIVPEVTSEPDYDAALAALANA
jgi:thiol peroxidase